jgi:GTPase Era involved in 16S rRNA processing
MDLLQENMKKLDFEYIPVSTVTGENILLLTERIVNMLNSLVPMLEKESLSDEKTKDILMMEGTASNSVTNSRDSMNESQTVSAAL